MAMDKNKEAVIKREMADRYILYKNGCAYIPLQDLPSYMNAFKEVYGKQQKVLKQC